MWWTRPLSTSASHIHTAGATASRLLYETLWARRAGWRSGSWAWRCLPPHDSSLPSTVLTPPGEWKQGLAPTGSIVAKKVVVACKARGPPGTLGPVWQLECPAALKGKGLTVDWGLTR